MVLCPLATLLLCIPDGSNVDYAPGPKTDPQICNLYTEVEDFDQDLCDLVAMCHRHTYFQLPTVCLILLLRALVAAIRDVNGTCVSKLSHL